AVFPSSASCKLAATTERTGPFLTGTPAARLILSHPPRIPGSHTMHIHGIIPPVATPMLANEDLDLPRLRWFLDHLIANGVHGIFVLGTNSEFYALDEREKQEVIAT